ncbi:MAG TPA: thiol-disulfide isomerase [Elusimicrobia bacterium]|nr:thiol-disulfide isomerase [Elusimicrobiota bacterium]
MPSSKGPPRRTNKGLGRSPRKKYVLHLYIAGLSPRSQRALRNTYKICAEHLRGRYQLEVHDIYQNPLMAKNGQILAAPTLVKELPLPLRRFVGDMSDTRRLLVCLDLRAAE